MLDLEPILAAVRQAADLTRRVRQQHIANAKADSSPVTIADYGSQALLCRAISQAFPGDAVMAEERAAQFLTLVSEAERARVAAAVGAVLGETVSEADLVRWLDHGHERAAARTWIIDPIDGTKGYIGGRRYSIAVAALEDGVVTAGVLGSPGYPTADGHGLLFYAQRMAAFVEPMAGGRAARIAVSTRTAPRSLRVVESVEKSHGDHPGKERVYARLGIDPAQIVAIDSQDKFAAVAFGEADLFLRFVSSPRLQTWDYAAGTALLLAAGGAVTDLDGGLIDFTAGPLLANNRGVIASNGAVHQQVIEAVQLVLAEYEDGMLH